MTAAAEPLSPAEVAETAAWIASVQLPSGMIPWYPGGHADPWNHTEAAMALDLAGRHAEAERALAWLAATQLPDGTWCCYHLADGVEDPRRDPNVGAYVATGVWWHYSLTGDRGALEDLWPVVEAAMGFALRLQRPGGEVSWSMDPDGHVGGFALLTGTASIAHSLRCAAAIAEHLGYERPDWQSAAARAARAVARRPRAFADKGRWAMDWYYPVLCGAVPGPAGLARLAARWDEFVIEGLGARCVSDRPWATAAETAELALALDAAGDPARAAEVVAWTRHFRHVDGGYWTGCVHPECVRFPGGERSTYSAAAVLLADYVVGGRGPGTGVFRPGARGQALPSGVGQPVGVASSERTAERPDAMHDGSPAPR